MVKDSSYKISFACAASVHLLLIILLCIKFTHNAEQPSLQSSTNIIKAFSINQNTVDKYLKQVKTEKKQTQQAEEKVSIEQQQQIEQKIVEEKKEKLEQQLKQQMLAEQVKEAQIIKKQQKQSEEKQKAETAKQEEKKLQDNLQKQLAQEANQLKKQTKTTDTTSKENSESANSNSSPQSSGEIDKYKALIIQAISQEWIVPDDVEKDATCKILVKVAPGGVVLSAEIIQSSGNEALDRSAQTAVLKATPLPVPKDGALFDNFRSIQLTVHPQEIVSE